MSKFTDFLIFVTFEMFLFYGFIMYLKKFEPKLFQVVLDYKDVISKMKILEKDVKELEVLERVKMDRNIYLTNEIKKLQLQKNNLDKYIKEKQEKEIREVVEKSKK